MKYRIDTDKALGLAVCWASVATTITIIISPIFLF